MKKYGVRSVLVVPLLAGDNPLGVIFLNHNSSPVTFTDAQIDFATKLGTSISLALEKARLMRILKLRAAELEAANKELDNFSYTISHDLKSPLRSLQGFAQALIDDYIDKLDEEGKDFLLRITSAGERMTQLIDAMLEVARLTDRNLISRSIDLSSIAEVIANELKKNEPDRYVEFAIAKGVQAQGDLDMLEIVLRNLLDNAWKFTSKHASARIEFGTTNIAECGLRNAEHINFGMRNSEFGMKAQTSAELGMEKSEIRNQQSEIVYFVRDDGAGFDMEFADKLFMPFMRLHSASEFPGLGIGLATVKKIINKHGGKIWAEGEPEKGATFYFTLG
jgi:light-regulated signal transduction histidine kinase (bacteriophytochrome)